MSDGSTGRSGVGRRWKFPSEGIGGSPLSDVESSSVLGQSERSSLKSDRLLEKRT